MNLSLSNTDHLRSTYVTDKGVPLYQVQTPSKLTGRTAIISRLVSDPLPGVLPGNSHYAFVGQVEFHSLRPSIIRRAGTEREATTFFRKESFGWHGRDRVFTGPDGQEYRWTHRNNGLELVTNDESKTLIAAFHSGHTGIIRKPQTTFLEITPAGLPMADLVILTFVYIKKLGDDGQRADSLMVATPQVAPHPTAATTA